MKNERLKRSNEVFLVPFEQIELDEQNNNKRMEFGDIDGLADSIENSGLKTPLLLKKVRGEERFILLHGHRRFRAIQLLINRGVEFAGIKSFLAPVDYTNDNVLLDMITMNDGKPFTNLEQGLVFVQLVDRGFNEAEISKKVGKSTSHIRNCMEMASLPKKIQNMIASGSLSGLTAVELSKNVKSEDELIAQIEAAVEQAPVSEDGKKKKITKKNVEKIANSSPLKKMEELKAKLSEQGIVNKNTALLDKLVSRLKAKQSVEEIIEIFQ